MIPIGVSLENMKYEYKQKRGDFEKVRGESFVHALNFTEKELEIESFQVSDLETVVSQSVPDLSERSVSQIVW